MARYGLGYGMIWHGTVWYKSVWWEGTRTRTRCDCHSFATVTATRTPRFTKASLHCYTSAHTSLRHSSTRRALRTKHIWVGGGAHLEFHTAPPPPVLLDQSVQMAVTCRASCNRAQQHRVHCSRCAGWQAWLPHGLHSLFIQRPSPPWPPLQERPQIKRVVHTVVLQYSVFRCARLSGL
jgi:hypothetical protein